MYITILSFKNKHGSKALNIDGIVKLAKEPSNEFDQEAIACEVRHFGKIGYVANSTNTVTKGTMSAGRLYDKISDEYFAKIKFITDHNAIAEVLSDEEFKSEIENPESDVHYLCDKPEELGLKSVIP